MPFKILNFTRGPPLVLFQPSQGRGQSQGHGPGFPLVYDKDNAWFFKKMSAYFKNEALALQQRMKRAFFVQSPLKCATQLLNHSSMM